MDNDYSVSKPVAVGLLLAVTVIIASLIGVIVFNLDAGLFDRGTNINQAAFDIEETDDSLLIEPLAVNEGDEISVVRGSTGETVMTIDAEDVGNIINLAKEHDITLKEGEVINLVNLVTGELVAQHEVSSDIGTGDEEDEEDGSVLSTVVVDNSFNNTELQNNSKFSNIKRAISGSNASELKVIINKGNSHSGSPYKSQMVGKDYEMFSGKTINISKSLILQGRNNPRIEDLTIYGYNDIKVKDLQVGYSIQLLGNKTKFNNINSLESGNIGVGSKIDLLTNPSTVDSTRGKLTFVNSEIKALVSSGMNKVVVKDSKTERQIHRAAKDIDVDDVYFLIDDTYPGFSGGLVEGIFQYDDRNDIVQEESISIEDSKFNTTYTRTILSKIAINDSVKSVNVNNIEMVKDKNKFAGVGFYASDFEGKSLGNIDISNIDNTYGIRVLANSVNNLDLNNIEADMSDTSNSNMLIRLEDYGDISVENSRFNDNDASTWKLKINGGTFNTNNISTNNSLKIEVPNLDSNVEDPVFNFSDPSTATFNMGGVDNVKSFEECDQSKSTINGVDSSKIINKSCS